MVTIGHLAYAFVTQSLLGTMACVTYAVLAGVFAVVFFFERRGRKRFLSSEFRLEIVYAVLMIGGVYGLAQYPVLARITALFQSHQAWLQYSAVHQAPNALRLLAFIVVADFLRYWKHRAMHAVPMLWSFHRVHHAATSLSILTNYRLHFVEVLLDSSVTLIPLLLLAAPTVDWLPIYVLLTVLTALQHSGLDIDYGPLGRIIVSPRYHSVHHSAAPEDFDSNFGATFAIWDRMFGTARFAPAPARHGLEDGDVPPTLAGQFLYPFARCYRSVSLILAQRSWMAPALEKGPLEQVAEAPQV